MWKRTLHQIVDKLGKLDLIVSVVLGYCFGFFLFIIAQLAVLNVLKNIIMMMVNTFIVQCMTSYNSYTVDIIDMA